MTECLAVPQPVDPRKAPSANGRADVVTDLEIGSRLRTLRLAAGLPQQALADALGVSYQQIQKYETGGNRLTAGRLYELAVLLGCPVDAFFGSSGGPVPSPARSLQTIQTMHRFVTGAAPETREAVLSLLRSLASDAPSEQKQGGIHAQGRQEGPARQLDRAGFVAAVAEALRAQAPVCVVLIDLDHFKAVNDAHGHALGDAFLASVSDRIAAALRAGDRFARIGGDEFALLLGQVSERSQATAILSRIREAVSAPLALEGREFLPRLSMGAALSSEGAGDAEALLRAADAALAASKHAGRGMHSFFDRAMAAAIRRRAELASALPAALEAGSLDVVLQPQRRLVDRRGFVFEALARWRHGGAAVPPAEFVPVAEEIGLIGPFTDAVLTAALDACRRLRQERTLDARVAVNVSARHVLQSDFVEAVERRLDVADLPPTSLELELSETALLDRLFEPMIEPLRRLCARGVVLSLDDVGTGHASLALLTQLPVRRLKIDGRFIRMLGRSDGAAQVVTAVIALGRSLGMETVAEAVETDQQLAFLASVGCDFAQGHLVGGPLPVEDILRGES